MLRSLLKDSAVYGIGIVLSRLVGFIMIPIYTRVLSPADYGIIETIVRVVDVFGLVLALGISSALMRYYNEASEGRDRRRLISTSLLVIGAATAASMLLAFPASPWVTKLAFGSTEHQGYVLIALLGMLLQLVSNIPLTLLRAEERAWRFTIISTIQLLTALSLNILLVVYWRMGVEGVVLSQFINALIWAVVLGLDLVVRHGIAFDRGWAGRLLAFGIPLVPAGIAQFTLHFSDRFFLTRFATIDELGLYSLAYRFAMLATTFYGMLDTAWWPWAFRVAREPDAPSNLKNGVALMLTASTVFVTGVILFSAPTIQLLAAEDFWAASRYVPPLTAAYWLFSTVAPLSVGLHLAERTGILAAANAFAAVVCLGLSFWIIPTHGVWGAIGVTIASFGLLSLAVAAGARMAHPIPHRLGMTALCVAVVGASMIWEYVGAEGFWVDLGVRILVWLGLLAVLALGFLRGSSPPQTVAGVIAQIRNR